MTDYLNDSPIENLEDDCYGVAPFAKSFAKSVRDIKNPVGTTVALNGPWGSGKSSTVNLIRRELESFKDESLVVSDFKCWWYRGEEALALAFLQNLHSVLSDTLADKVKNLLPKIGQSLLQAGPVIGAAASLTPFGVVAPVSGAALDFAKRFFPEGDTLEATFKKLSDILAKENRRFLIIIDDIDRLSPDEALAIFRLVKSVGRLPNVLYLLVFDRTLADNAVAQRYPSEGPHFLEKIIQAAFELPAPSQSDLNEAVFASIQQVCGDAVEKDITEVMNYFYDVVAPYLNSPRHVVRFQNAIAVTWPAIKNEVSVADFIALETLRLYEPSLFQAIRSNKEKLCGLSSDSTPNDDHDNRFQVFLEDIPKDRNAIAKVALQRLFPRIRSTGFGNGFLSQWDAQRRVCIEKHFDTYFRLSLSDDALSMTEIEEFIERTDDTHYIQSLFRKAAATNRKNGATMVPVYFDELNSHATRIDKDNVEPLLTALFEIHDEIDLEADGEKGFGMFANTSLRYHWFIRRLTLEQFSLDERTQLYSNAIKKASLGWLVDFVASAKGHYRDPKKLKREEECLIAETAVPEFVQHALFGIREAATNDSLLAHQDLSNILFRWRDFNDGDASEVKEWTDRLMQNDEALVIFAKSFTGEGFSFSAGFDGLGDRVSQKTTSAVITDDIDILDPVAFRAGLERIMNAHNMDEQSMQIVRNFLAAWDRRKAGEDMW